MSLSDPTKKQSTVNREVMCPSSCERNQDASLSPELDEGDLTQPDTPSCDESAFAAGYDSAGMSQAAGGYNPVGSGDECLQTYAKKGSHGIWHLVRDLRHPLPAEWGPRIRAGSDAHGTRRPSCPVGVGTTAGGRLPGFRNYSSVTAGHNLLLRIHTAEEPAMPPFGPRSWPSPSRRV